MKQSVRTMSPSRSLSYAAGLMTAAEIAKLAINGKAAQENRVFFQPRAVAFFQAATLERKQGCTCNTRDDKTYRESIDGLTLCDVVIVTNYD